MEKDGSTALALVIALASALIAENALSSEAFIASIRKHALQLKAADAEDLADTLLAIASTFATGQPLQC